MDKMSIVCIQCPLGCRLDVFQEKDGKITVQGNACLNGEKYAIQEIRDPRRILATTVKTSSRKHPRLSVRTAEEIPLRLIFEAMKVINLVSVTKPAKTGDILLKNILDTGVDVIATGSLKDLEK